VRNVIHLMVLLCVSLLLSHAAQAHLFAPSLLEVSEFKPHSYNVVWKTPSNTTSNISLLPIWPDNCDVHAVSPPRAEGTGLVSSWQLLCDSSNKQGLVGQTLGVSGLGPNQVSAMVILSLGDGRNYQKILTEQAPEFRVPVEPSQTQVIAEYSVLGAEHIWSGVDHLMFVFGLLLLVGVGSRLIWTITAFTIGHSITLSLVTLGFLSYPVLLIEFTIALSLFILAINLARSDKGGLFRYYPWWLAGGFGLLHGMGFAGALVQIGLPQSSVPLALLFFNLGIEAGQIVFIVLLLSIWHFLKHALSNWQERLLPVPVYALGGLSAMWCFERGLVLLRSLH